MNIPKLIQVWSCCALFAQFSMTALRAAEEEKPKAEAKKPPEIEVQHGPDGDVVFLSAAVQKRIGLERKALVAAQIPRELKAFGRVLDPAPLAIAVSELAQARTAAKNSMTEYARLKNLSGDQNVSARVVEAGEAAAQRDQLIAENALNKIILTWGLKLGSRGDLFDFSRKLVRQEAALVRVDLLAGETLETEPNGARLGLATAQTEFVTAELIGPAAGSDAQTLGHGFVFMVEPNAGGLVPGTSLAAFLQLPGKPLEGVIVPLAAVLRHEGKACVYVESAPDKFQREEIKLEHPAELGWFVTEGLKPGQKVVVAGAQTLLSEEISGHGTGGE